jgi:hypothetical protein
MRYFTDSHSRARAAVDLTCRQLGLGGVEVGTYRSGKSLPEVMSLRGMCHVAVDNAPDAERRNWPQQFDLAQRAMSTSDFPNILADVANKQMAASYTAKPASFTKWASRGFIGNFKPLQVSRVTAPGVLPEVMESAEYQKIYLDDESEVVRLRTYGGILGLTRQAIINDDLGALRDRALMLAQAAALTQGSIATATLTGTAAMSDGLPLFDAGRNNLLTGSTSALSADSLAAAVAAMRRFADRNGQPLSIEPKYLVVGPGLERLAYQLCYSDADPGTSNSGTVNFIKESVGLNVVVEPLLEASSLTAWYLLPDPAFVPVVRYYTLDGADLAPYIESRTGFETDCLEFKTRIDFAAGAVSTYAIKSAGV